MKKTFVMLHLFLCSVLNCLPSQTAPTFHVPSISEERFALILQKVQHKLNELHASRRFPGATVGFVLPDSRSAAVAAGVSDLATKVPLRPTDKMLAGSIGKTFVAAETLLLVQEGRLNLDETIGRWLGAEKWFARLPNATDITLRMLLNHSSGIPNHLDDGNFVKAATKNTDIDTKYEDLLVYVLGKKPLFAAGKGYHYTDTNYIVIGLIVEKVTGTTLYDEITRRLLKPLDLNHTIPANNRALLQTVNGYTRGKPLIVKGRFSINPQWEWAGGGFASTAQDLARWAKALYEGRVLDRKYLDEMLNSTTVGEGARYGLGAEVVHTKLGTTYGHDGEFPGFLSDMRYFAQYKIAVAAQVNADETPAANAFMESAVLDFAQVIIDELFADALSDAEKSHLRKRAEDWLNLVHTGHVGDSWEDLSSALRAKYAKDKWPSALEPLLQKVGVFKSRTLKSVSYSDSETRTVDFESSFSKAREATEIVTLKLEPDGEWRVASYAVK